jgi:hypothetical protein
LSVSFSRDGRKGEGCNEKDEETKESRKKNTGKNSDK